MEKFVKGDVEVVPFPFSDLTQAKRRPALILSVLQGDDLVLCQITSQQIKDEYAVLIDDHYFDKGKLNQSSNVRPNRLFTADGHIILYRVGHLKKIKLFQIVERVVKILRN